MYSLALYLLTPLVLLYLLLRGLRSPAYLRRWPERFGQFDSPAAPGGIVVHAVSVGEVNAAAPLVRALAARFPARPLAMTCFTPTGSERIISLFGSAVHHVYAPLDLPGPVRRFFDHLRPALLIVMETEIWPNLFAEAGRRGIPVLIANARISDRSLGRYRRFRGWTRAALSHASRIAAQGEQDARRLCEIGAPPDRVEVTGQLKFDLQVAAGVVERGRELRQRWGSERPVLVAGSTHEGDETVLLAAFAGLLRTLPDALLVVVPRHPERFGRAAQRARGAGFAVELFSRSPGDRSTQCYVVDAMGELMNFYAAGDLAFVGGTFECIGGHNLLEPAALGVPVLVGPHTFNFESVTIRLLECGGAWRVTDATVLEQAALRLLLDPALRARMGQAGLQLVRSQQGALGRTLDLAAGLLDHSSS